jgi:hypothetical protein
VQRCLADIKENVSHRYKFSCCHDGSSSRLKLVKYLLEFMEDEKWKRYTALSGELAFEEDMDLS